MKESEETIVGGLYPEEGPSDPMRTRPVLVVMNDDRFSEWHILKQRATSMGRDPGAALQLRDDTVSRIHAVIEYGNHQLDETPECWLADNESRNGTFLNGIKITNRERLHNGDRIFVGNTSLTYFVRTEDEILSSKRLQQLATIDTLTGLPNKVFMLSEYEREFERAQRYNRPVSLVMMGLDDFKKVNEAHGVQVGDYVLKRTGKLITARIRSHDIAARFGGDEFALLMPETNLQGALVMSERLRNSVGSHVFTTDDTQVRLTMSVGVTQYNPLTDETLKDVIERGATALIQAKGKGKNFVQSLD